MYRKYLSEFGLNIFTSYKVFLPLEKVYDYVDDHIYNIYMIAKSPRVCIEENSVVITENKITLNIIDKKNNFKITTSISFDSNIDHRIINYEVFNNGESIRLRANENYIRNAFLNSNIDIDSRLFVDGEYRIVIEAGLLWFNECYKINRKVYFDVLYIGQSYSENSNRCAQVRLKSHSKLQKILQDFYLERCDERIFAFLFELDILNCIDIDGFNKNSISSVEDENLHFNNLMDYEHTNRQIINIFEAALINYFKPKYNINFIDNFPNNNSKGFSDYFSLDYNLLIVEIDLEFEEALISLRTDTAEISEQNGIIKYKLYNDPKRKNMLDIFSD